MALLQSQVSTDLGLERRWKELYDRRFSWASQAREEFLDELESDAVERLAKHIQTTDHREAVVIGEAQSGKTTLILRMFGVAKPASRARVEAVLRGARRPGNSSTSTATIFSVSQDDRFRIQRPSDAEPIALSDKETRERLRGIRAQMESGQLTRFHSVKIELPRGAIDRPVDASSDPLDIVDLPGLNSVSAEEQRHARDLVNVHLQRAHLVLLVGKADGVAHLRAWLQEDRGLLNNEAWMYQNSRFAIALTHALSSKSIQQKILGSGGPDSLEDYVGWYRSAIEHEWRHSVGATEAKAVASLPIYPLEFAPSECTVEASKEAQIDQWTTELVADLIAKVRDSKSEVAELRFLVNSFYSAEKRVEQERQRFERQIEMLDQTLRNKRSLRRVSAMQIGELESRAEDLLKQIKDVKEEDYLGDGLAQYTEYGDDPIFWAGPPVKYLREQKRQCILHAQEAKDAITRIRQELEFQHREREDVTIVEDVREMAKREANPTINGIQKGTPLVLRGRYWKTRVRKAAKKMVAERQRLIEAAVEKEKQKATQAITSQLQEVRQQLSVLKTSRKEQSRAISDLKQKKVLMEAEYEKKDERMTRDLGRWEELKAHFQSAFDRRVREITGAADGLDRAGQVLSIAYLHQINRVYEALIHGDI